MGQSTSTHSSHKTRKTSKKITLSGMGKGKSNNSKNLSHTFSFPDETLKLNVNIATEEELMTLPGICRNLASNIVSHRLMIGRFNRVEDLALVSGVGAHKLELFKLEVYVPSTSASGTSSRASISMESSMGNAESVVDVNGASIFALQGVPGVNQELASKIVERRSKYGPYRSLDELAKLRGMEKHRLAMIKPYLKINGISNGTVTPTPSNGSSLPPCNGGPQASSTPKVKNSSRQPTRTHRNRAITPSKM